MGLLEEIRDIPELAAVCYKKNYNKIKLSENIPYIGMGSSYFAPLTLQFCGKNIYPYIASEYFYYAKSKVPKAVLISQSGESSETLWCADKVDNIIAITNDTNSSLSKLENIEKLIEIRCGSENYSSTKSYINTLICLYIGLGIDPGKAVKILGYKFDEYSNKSRLTANEVFEKTKSAKVSGYYVLGSGPNWGTALEGALTLTETTKLPWQGMTVAQYDHGIKEGAGNSIVILLNSHGKDEKRLSTLKKNITKNSRCTIIEIAEDNLSEELSPIIFIARLNLFMNYIGDLMKVGDTFVLGSKVTKSIK